MAAGVLVAPSARADKPEPALAFFAGASIFLAGFALGGTLLATSQSNDSQDNAGWLTIEGAFAAAPLVSHALSGEWARGVVFSGLPAATLAGTATLFASDGAAIVHGALVEQRVLWALFGVGLFSGAAGVVDSTFAGKRAAAIAVAPVLGSRQAGLQLVGTL
jgi:hypothetical protein